MITNKLMGGLGNYMFQIATAYATALRDGKKYVCDTSNMIIPHKNYNHYLPNLFKKIEFESIEYNIDQYVEIGFNFSEIPKTNSSLRIVGYFQSEKYFKEYREYIIELFDVDSIYSTPKLQTYSNLLTNNTCSIHVRRNDYLALQNYHVVQPIEYYENAVNIVGLDKTYLIFSDDIPWCKENLSFIKNKILIENNLDYEDMCLMSKCSNNIIANSSFSWWGTWLNTNPDKIVVAPKKWFGVKNLHLNTSDLYCSNWQII